ncbi:hypothetical protein PAXRUDRAFT_135642 [Paxillus rubicundulus Ve08.2h10]|uniref:Unplaced genomic scaffold scaffold_99, whole genome shotgun sequence n=1 Tax=Paxillus rubicundulus Ve08.2h10 TaxID=930991 RepID=A0A0D0EBK1_9AGAM|nr:hypothetical protein PAXRUDRAFT_135642 [Paxillus rubicundulus Ve08.2h10]
MPSFEVNGLLPTKTPNGLEKALEANTYVWCHPLSELRPNLWRFEEFVRDNAWKWVGCESQSNKDYAEVDKRRAMQGIIVR